MTNVVIASAARTAVGSFSGSFGNTPAHDLGTTVLEALVSRARVDKSEVSETIMGQVLTAGQGQNPARQVWQHLPRARAHGQPLHNRVQAIENSGTYFLIFS